MATNAVSPRGQMSGKSYAPMSSWNAVLKILIQAYSKVPTKDIFVYRDPPYGQYMDRYNWLKKERITRDMTKFFFKSQIITEDYF